jgi:hypothetical protein
LQPNFEYSGVDLSTVLPPERVADMPGKHKRNVPALKGSPSLTGIARHGQLIWQFRHLRQPRVLNPSRRETAFIIRMRVIITPNHEAHNLRRKSTLDWLREFIRVMKRTVEVHPSPREPGMLHDLGAGKTFPGVSLESTIAPGIPAAIASA